MFSRRVGSEPLFFCVVENLLLLMVTQSSNTMVPVLNLGSKRKKVALYKTDTKYMLWILIDSAEKKLYILRFLRWTSSCHPGGANHFCQSGSASLPTPCNLDMGSWEGKWGGKGRSGAEERKCTQAWCGERGDSSLRMRRLRLGCSLPSLLLQPALPGPKLPGPTHRFWALCWTELFLLTGPVLCSILLLF